MVLLDTSIWIEFLKVNPDYADDVELLLESKQVITIEPIFAELLFGARSNKEKDIILSYWKILPRIKFTEGSFIESADFANKQNYHNVGIGLIDSILSKATVDNKFHIWTLDKKILNNLDKQFLYR
jgi:predicted nucleic acid-binding protein